jgi:hypothetical protein
MLSNLPALKIVSTLTMFINSQRRFMGSNKPQEYGMNACEISLSLMVSKSEKPILLSLLKPLQKICLYAKFTLMISYLGLLTNILVKSCRCFGSDRTPGVAPQGVFRSRTVSTTVAKMVRADRTRDNGQDLQVRAA